MSFTVIIPARYGSTRLPGKPLADLAGKPMIQRVYEQVLKSNAERVVIATDNEKIKRVAENIGAEAIMTSPNHLTGTDRLEETVRLLQLDDDYPIVNVQGDEPFIPPTVINQVAARLQNRYEQVATLSYKISRKEDLLNPNIVKVVVDCNNCALLFSRSIIPWDKKHNPYTENSYALSNLSIYQRHLGIYAYRVSLLKAFATWSAPALERIESLEQLRILWYGHRIYVEEACEVPPKGIDTKEDLQEAQRSYNERAVTESEIS